jgi:uracil-DNA glycosylase
MGMVISKSLDLSWQRVLGDEFEKAYFKELRVFLKKEIDSGKTVFPVSAEYFAAFNATKFGDVSVVLLGQDPYHGEGQAHGLCFSVQKGIRPPPSLLNIYKELEADLGIPRAHDGDLSNWAKQGVLLLNSVLTVRESEAGSHRKRGWEEFTDRAICEINDRRENVVFVLWGAYAQKKGAFIDRKRHYVIESAHPSPLSASRGFLGSRPFSKINTYLRQHGAREIDWRVGVEP